jgi:beta-lactamase regulating signal transducer with metallopeptidase domain
MVLERLAGSLLHLFWQGAAIAILAALALKLLERRPAEWRYAAASAALLAMLAAPVATFIFYSQTGALALSLLRGLNGAATAAAEASAADVAIWTRRIVLLWLGGVAVCLIRLLGGWVLSRRLVRSATTVVTPAVIAALDRARAALALSRPVRLLTGLRIEAPVVIGWLRPAILLPATALTGLDPDRLLAILAHELAHVRRHDFLVNALQRFVECVLFYHPAVWWVSGRIRVERERCRDDLAVRVCGDKLVYAEALIALEKARTRTLLLSASAPPRQWRWRKAETTPRSSNCSSTPAPNRRPADRSQGIRDFRKAAPAPEAVHRRIAPFPNHGIECRHGAFRGPTYGATKGRNPRRHRGGGGPDRRGMAADRPLRLARGSRGQRRRHRSLH